MSKPKIGISLRIIDTKNYNEQRDALSQDWPIILEELGLVPVYIPNKLADVKNFVDEFSIDGLILSGGDNLGENVDRDKTEFELVKYAINKKIPILGVCRGMQLINDYFGGKLTITKSGDHVGKHHEIEITKEKFSSLFNCQSITVNSYHNNLIDKDKIAKDLKDFAIYKNDATVEGFYHPSLPIVGVMWHPERERNFYNKLILSTVLKDKKFWD